MFENLETPKPAPKRRGRPRKVDVPVSAEEAVRKAFEAGEELVHTQDAAGQDLVQRPVSLRKEAPPALKKGARTKVYNKYRARLFCSDTVLEPESVGSILVSDLQKPSIASKVIEVK